MRRYSVALVLVLATASQLGGTPARADAVALEDRYREALTLWAAGSEEQAVALLAELELTLTQRVACFDWIEDHTAEELAAIRGDALLSVALLQSELFDWRERQGRLVLPVRRLKRARDSALWQGSHHELDRGELAASWAIVLTEIGRVGRRIRYQATLEVVLEIFRSAIALAPGYLPAVAGAADAAEKLGHSSAAADLWRRVAAAEGRPGRARFGLGLNLMRSGETTAGEKVLRSLTESEAPDWIRALSFGELARAGNAVDRAGAIALLTAAVEQLPHEPTLRAALYLLHPDAGSSSSALASLASASPRSLYDEGPLDSFAQAQGAAREVDRRARRSLAEALSLTRRPPGARPNPAVCNNLRPLVR